MPPCLEPRDVGGFLAALGIHAAELEYIALESGWQSRAPRKITAAALLSPLCAPTLGGTASLNDIAAAINDGSGRHPSRQAVAERFEQPCLTMIQSVAKRVAASLQDAGQEQGLLSRFSVCSSRTAPSLSCPPGSLKPSPASAMPPARSAMPASRPSMASGASWPSRPSPSTPTARMTSKPPLRAGAASGRPRPARPGLPQPGRSAAPSPGRGALH